jgi:RHS repeat-associated protein
MKAVTAGQANWHRLFQHANEGGGTQGWLIGRYNNTNDTNTTSATNATCDTRIAYDVNGKRIAEYQVGGRAFSAYIGDTFRYQHSLIVDHASLTVMLDGRRIALKRFRPQLRAATLDMIAIELPTPWIIGGLGGAGVLWLIRAFRKGAFVLVQLRPLRSAAALTTTSLLLIPSIALGAVPTNASPPKYFWEITDSLGTGMVLLNQNGERVRHQVFTPFGEIHDEVGANFRTLFAGHRRDEDSGMFYMQARWYDPGSGGFLSIDPLVPSATDPQSLNPYSYARNNPLNLTDPDGRCWRAGITCGIHQPALVAAQTRTTTVTLVWRGEPVSEYSLSQTVSASGGIFGGADSTASSLSEAARSARRGSNSGAPNQAGVDSSRGFWRSLGGFLLGESLEIFGSVVGTLHGIGVGILRIGQGIVAGDLGMIGRGIRTLGSALVMPRAGSASGLGWPGTPGNTGITPTTGTKLNNASIWHDTYTGTVGLGSAAQFGWIERAWTGPGFELGLFGQAYRLVGTAAFGLAGAAQAATGF